MVRQLLRELHLSIRLPQGRSASSGWMARGAVCERLRNDPFDSISPVDWVGYLFIEPNFLCIRSLFELQKKPKQMDTMPFEQRARFQSRAARESASCSNKHIYHTSEINLTIQPARLLDYYPKLISLSTMYWKLQPVAHSVVHVSRCHERQGSTF